MARPPRTPGEPATRPMAWRAREQDEDRLDRICAQLPELTRGGVVRLALERLEALLQDGFRPGGSND